MDTRRKNKAIRQIDLSKHLTAAAEETRIKEKTIWIKVQEFRELMKFDADAKSTGIEEEQDLQCGYDGETEFQIGQPPCSWRGRFHAALCFKRQFYAVTVRSLTKEGSAMQIANGTKP